MPVLASVQHLVGVVDIRQQSIILQDDSLVAVLICQSLPIALRGADEAVQIVLALQAIIRSVPLDLQFLTEVAPLDVDRLVATHRQVSADERLPSIRALAEAQRHFVLQLAGSHQILERRCYLILRQPAPVSLVTGWQTWWPFGRSSPRRATTVERTTQLGQLALLCQELSAGLRAAQITCRRLTNDELAGLLYRQLQDDLAERQPLPTRLHELADGLVYCHGPIDRSA